MVQRTVTVKCDSFDDFAHFPVVPLISVSSVSYVDGAGANQTLSTDVYEVRTDGLVASLALKSGQTWPTPRTGSRITATAVVGYATVPPSVKHAMLLLVAHWVAERETVNVGNIVNTVPHAADALLVNYRTHA